MTVSAKSTKCPPWHPSFHLNLSILLPIPPENIPVTLDFGEDTIILTKYTAGSYVVSSAFLASYAGYSIPPYPALILIFF
ncbi:MAG: hypothetical protein D3921_15710 [Candidatus Electrothrix sp. AW1]|nr:hypothetical protein [Candidatus Electrothrix sp. AX1]MCI5183939.1 hypothetical protein [Candidatus Electrothrix gigas]